MTKQKTEQATAQDKSTKQYDKPLQQPGGIYFHSGVIVGCKNIFVTNEYINLMLNAFKMAEIKKDIKNLAYVVMPNFFYWVFKLSENQSDPLPIIRDLKGETAREIMTNLQNEVKEKPYEMIDLFKTNDKVNRSIPQKIIWTLEEQAKEFEQNKRYKVWAPKTGLRLLDSDELLQQKLAIIKKAPVSERWQMVSKAENYPYLYLSEELEDVEPAQATLASLAMSVEQPAAVKATA